jgi:hypothetical protein
MNMLFAAVHESAADPIRSPASLHPDIGRPDDLSPFFGVFGDKFADVNGRSGKHGRSKIGKPCLDFGIGERRVNLTVELADGLSRSVARRAEAYPRARVVARYEIADTWKVG